MSNSASNTSHVLNSKTQNFPNGVMGSLHAELGLMAGFIGAFILAFAIWCIVFKYFSDKEDREQAKMLVKGSLRSLGDIEGPTGTAVQCGENDVLGEEQRL
jgi:hypothetical protein